MNPPRLIFLNRVYWPEEAATAQLLHDLATGLADRGVPVRVITARRAGLPAAEHAAGVDVRRVRSFVPRGGGLLSRAGNYTGYAFAALRALAREAAPGDVVVAMTDPPLLGVGAARVARRRGLRLWHWCQDVYPEVAMALTPTRPLRDLLGALRPARDRAWREAEGCVVLGADMAALLAARGVPAERIHVQPNWAPRGLAPAEGTGRRRAWRLEGRFVVAYSGNLGRVHALEPVLAVAERLRARRDIGFVFIGSGPQRATLEAGARARRLDNLRFLPAQPRALLAESLAAADLHLVTLRAGCEGTVWPSKFYGIVAAARPVLYLGPPGAEVGALVARHGLGGSFAPEDPAAVAAFIAELADAPARAEQLRGEVGRFAATLPGLAYALQRWEATYRAPLAPRPG